MSMSSGWVRNFAGSAPAGAAGFATSATGGGGGGGSFLGAAPRKRVDVAILVAATRMCRCMFALSYKRKGPRAENTTQDARPDWSPTKSTKWVRWVGFSRLFRPGALI